ncbi:NOB1 family endonuclease [Halospeciosus flavus]|uniref:NOB1 family endonuclease n=1 Tax=Halospeciosus flavus TaxID=3032283 RepID=A0ABD5Z8H6_9EURY|nr:NOB1 family endonuclease [Halospeciosus flavus]
MQILDASAFIHEYSTDEQVASVPAVREELEGSSAYRFEAMEGSGMHVVVPGEDSIDQVRQAARKTGDADALSDTDVRVVAAALELDGTLVTDDYAMQNVADELDLDVEVIAREGIEEQREWQYQCQGCGRVFDAKKERCPVCGSDLTRKNPN